MHARYRVVYFHKVSVWTETTSCDVGPATFYYMNLFREMTMVHPNQVWFNFRHLVCLAEADASDILDDGYNIAV